MKSLENCQIYICSRGRARPDVQYTVGFLHPTGYPINVVVPAREAEDYRQMFNRKFPDGHDITVFERPEEVTNLAQSIEYIIYGLAIDHYAIIMDDDLRFSRRVSDVFSTEDVALRQCEPEDLENLLVELSKLLDEYPMVGVSARGGNNNQKNRIATSTRQMQVHGIDTKWFRQHDIRPSKVVCKSDFFMTLSVLTSGCENAILCDYTVDQAKASNAAGGVSIYRDLKTMNDAAHRLQELFPDYVTIVEKRVQWQGMEAGALDVRIQWKKAYKESFE